MNKRCRVALLALLVFCTVLIFPLSADATSVSQSAAVAWAQSKIDSGLDYDGQYGNQCVDLIYYYYSYLGVSPVGGNACDYSSNTLPSGWTRISSNITPQPGDIAVWKSDYNSGGYSTGWAGHIGIVVSGNSSTFSTIHQNFNGYTTCIQSNNIPTAILACVIRPNFSSTSSGVTLTWSEYADKQSIGTTNATLARRCDVSGASTAAVSKVGIYLYDYNGKQLDSFSETVDLGNYSYYTLWYNINDELGYTLAAGTTYKYKFMAVVSGDTYYSPVYSFQTKGTHAHSYDSGTVTTKATCTAKGVRTYTCITCGNTKTESIAATGHTYGSWSTTKDATCTATGTQKRTCSKCSNAETKTIAALGHNYASAWTVDKAATCTTEGSKSHHCTRCSGKGSVTAIAATGHSYGSWRTTTAATCTTTGAKKRNCSTCSNVETATIAVLGHDYASVWTTDKAATCATEGSKSHHCTRCSSLKDITIISALGHAWSEWIVTVQPTVTSTGLQARTCNNGCGSKETHMIAKLAQDGHDHIYDNWTVIKEPSCTEAGMQQKQCTVCKEIEQQSISATGHTFNEWEVVSASTCTQNGIKQRQCKNCSQSEQQISETIEHSYGQWEDSDIQGVQKRVCENCNNIEIKTTITENAPSTDINPTIAPIDKDTDNQDIKDGPATWFVIVICSVILLPVTTIIVTKLLKKK